MSGFSTTGATVIADVEALDRSLLIWRQLSQWLGGMGIIVLALAVLPRLRIGGRQMFESELPGPEVHQLADRIRDTARRLWLLYIALTLVLFALLLGIGLHGPRRPDERLRGARELTHDDPARRLLDREPLPRAVRAGDAVGGRALHGDRGAQLRAALPRPRPPPSTRPRARRGGTALRRAAPPRLGRGLRRASPRRPVLRRGGAPSGRLPDDVADDRHGLRDHRLRHVADAQHHGDDRPHVRRRLRRDRRRAR